MERQSLAIRQRGAGTRNPTNVQSHTNCLMPNEVKVDERLDGDDKTKVEVIKIIVAKL